MKALVYKGTKSVAVEDVPDAKIEHPTDAVIRLTTTNICGSDLHMYEGRTSVEEGKVLGHENMGIVEAVGDGVDFVKVGDRVSVPFNIACGACRNCVSGWTSFCTRMNPTEGMDGAAYGYANMGPYDGGQAEYLRVPRADFNLLNLPQGDEFENDFTMLSDIFPTGWHGVVLSGMQPGDRVAVFGGGPVGLMAAHSAQIMGASEVFVVDKQADRLKLADSIGAVGVDFSQGDPIEQILDKTGGVLLDRGVEAVGFQAHDSQGEEHPRSRWTTWSTSYARPAESESWASTSLRTRASTTRPPRIASTGSTARSSPRGSRWVRDRRRSSGTTVSFAT
jgi:glutathione-independent formaldehyde dehydrogenase